MTEIAVDGPAGPQTHAFVIGVGRYRHLKGGAVYNSKLEISAQQLSSPPISARAFADWLLGPYNPCNAPLATVELLLSEGTGTGPAIYQRPDTGGRVEVEPATMENVKKAFKRWRGRLKTADAADHVAVFYFSGHGSERFEQTLWCEDFGADHDAPFEGGFLFESTRRAMERCEARRQFYFVDACREKPSDWLLAKMLEDEAHALWEPQVTGKKLDSAVFRATARSAKAYGEENRVSYFTGALLDGLNGFASRQDKEGQWVVQGSLLHLSINLRFEYLRERGLAPELDKAPADLSTMEAFHTVGTTPPEMPYEIWCTPQRAHRRARLSVSFQGRTLKERGPAPKRWEITLRPRSYLLSAEFQDGRFEPVVDEEVLVTVPWDGRELKVTQRVGSGGKAEPR